VVPPGRALRRDPVGEVVDLVDGQLQALGLAHLQQAALAGVDRLAVDAEALGHTGVLEGDDVALAVVGQQHARLLEALANGRHPVGQAALVHVEPGAGLVVRAALAHRFQVGVTVGLVHGTTGKHVGTAHEVGLEVAPEHEDLEAAGAVPYQHHRGRVPHLDGHGYSSIRRWMRRRAAVRRAYRTGGRSRRMPAASVMKPGVRSRAPAKRMSTPSISSCPGTTPIWIRCWARRSTASPSRFTRAAPSTLRPTSRPMVQSTPMASPTLMITNNSAKGTTRNRTTRTGNTGRQCTGVLDRYRLRPWLIPRRGLPCPRTRGASGSSPER